MLKNTALATVLVSLLLQPFAAASFAQTRIDSSLDVKRADGGIRAESSFGVVRDGRLTGVESSLEVTGVEGRLKAESEFGVVRDGRSKGIESSLSVDGSQGGLKVNSTFGANNGSKLSDIKNSLSVKPGLKGASGPSPATLKKIVEYRRIADKMIAAEPAADSWWSGFNLCTDLSGKWLPELNKLGMKATLSATDSNAVKATVIADGRERQVYKFHVFLTDGSIDTGENEIIFDPTYRQFIAGADKLKGLPLIFIGTRADAERLFGRFKKYCRVEAGEDGDPLTGRYEIKSFTELIYSYGRNAGARQSFGGM